MSLTAGVIAVQGDVSEHADAIERAGAAHDETIEVREIRTDGVVPDCDLLLMPGGESTTISRLIHGEGIAPEIERHVADDKPVLATCAGLIVAAADVVDRSSTGNRNPRGSGDAGDDRVDTLGLIDATVERNAFGRQKDSFEAELPVAGLEAPFPAVFIRAPAIRETGATVELLAEWNGRPVGIRDGPVVGTAFHPELTADPRIHRLAFFEAPNHTQ